MSVILDQYGQPFQRQATSTALALKQRLLAARYEMAQSTAENRRHWIGADGLSADAANSPEVREILRNRARYEVMHNGYAKHIVKTISHETVGIGPLLAPKGFAKETARFIRRQFMDWFYAIGGPEKLRLMRRTRCIDGEAWAMMTTRRSLVTPVKLDVRLSEAERWTTPRLPAFQRNRIDGIVLNEDGDPIEYHLLKEHPGDTYRWLDAQYDKIDPRFVIHYFNPERPEQHRGICEILAALPLGAQLRRYTLATLSAAEIAALLTAILETEASPDTKIPDEPWELLELDRGMLTVAPAGWKAKQFESKQPTTVYPQFKGELVTEMGAGGGVPGPLAKADSSAHNFASGRLDLIPFTLDVEIDREFTERMVLDRWLAEWLREAATISGYLPVDIDRDNPTIEHEWRWQGRERGTDETKSANAQDTRLRNGMTSYANEFAKDGLDADDVHEEQAQALGMTIEDYRAMLRKTLFSDAINAAAAAGRNQNMDEEDEPAPPARQR